MKADIKRILEVAGIPLDSPRARRLIEAEQQKEEDQEQEKTQTTNLKLQELDKDKEEDNEEKEEKQEDEEKTMSISVVPAASPTPPVPVGSAQPITEPATTTTTPAPTTEQPPQDSVAVAPMAAGEVVKMFFEMRDQVHYYHLQTESYAEHKALNDFYETILDIADKFMEAYQGVNGRATGNITLTLKTYTAENVVADVKVFAEKVKQLQKSVETNTDLVNLLDELLNSCNKTIYLLSLK